MSDSSKAPVPGLHQLMERYIDGDKRAFMAIHRQLEPRLRGFLLKLVRDDSVCDDLVQLTLLKAHLARQRFRLPGHVMPWSRDADGAVQGWYFAIARNVAMDDLRSKYRASKRVSSDNSDIASDVADNRPNVEEMGTELEQEEQIISDVRAAIAQLPESQREVVEMHKLRGMTMAEIAERLAVREGAIRVRAHRAYRTLARLLQTKTVLLVLFISEVLR